MYDNALLLEGGAMRGLYTAGVLDAFMEAGLEFGCVLWRLGRRAQCSELRCAPARTQRKCQLYLHKRPPIPEHDQPAARSEHI